MSLHSLPLITMTTAQRLLSIMFLGSLAIALAPSASAATPHDLSDTDREALRAELRACRDQSDDRQVRRSCAKAAFEKYGMQKPKKHINRRRFRKNLSEDVRTELKACRDQSDDREVRKACAKQVLENHGIERQKRSRIRGRFSHLTDEQKSALRECRSAGSHQEIRSCMQRILNDSQN